jgi:multidrug resistance efflux pump
LQALLWLAVQAAEEQLVQARGEASAKHAECDAAAADLDAVRKQLQDLTGRFERTQKVTQIHMYTLST